MGTIRHLLSLALVMIALPIRSGEAPAVLHRTQALRTGMEHPRDRSTQAARPASPEAKAAAPAGRSQPYRPSQPGEGVPKG